MRFLTVWIQYTSVTDDGMTHTYRRLVITRLRIAKSCWGAIKTDNRERNGSIKSSKHRPCLRYSSSFSFWPCSDAWNFDTQRAPSFFMIDARNGRGAISARTWRCPSNTLACGWSIRWLSLIEARKEEQRVSLHSSDGQSISVELDNELSSRDGWKKFNLCWFIQRVMTCLLSVGALSYSAAIANAILYSSVQLPKTRLDKFRHHQEDQFDFKAITVWNRKPISV